jgi:hypothetical protein
MLQLLQLQPQTMMSKMISIQPQAKFKLLHCP